jgi:hypothetical protein
MVSTILTPDVVAREALMILRENTVTASLVYRDHEQEWAGAKVGDTVRIRRPASFDVDEFSTSINVQDITEGSVELIIEKHFDVSVGVTAKEWTLELDQFSERVIAPAMIGIASAIDQYILAKYVEIPYWAGLPAVDPWALADLSYARKVLNDNKAPLGMRNGIINTTTEAELLTLDAIVNAEKSGSTAALREASMGRLMGANWWMDQNMPGHTPGTFGGLSTITASAAAVGAETVTANSGSGTETVKIGDILSITTTAGVEDYVVTADAAAVTGGVACAISPPLVTELAGGEAIVFPCDDAAHNQDLLFHRNGIALAVVPLELPRGNSNAQIVNFEGFGIRIVYGYDMSAKKDTISFDVLVGSKVIQQALCMRILGGQVAKS